MTFDPETIAAILAVLIPMIQECMAKGKTEEEMVAMLLNPSRRQRFVLLFALRRQHRIKLRAYWQVEEQTLDEQMATELIEMAQEAA